MITYTINADGAKSPNSDDGIASWAFLVHDSTAKRIYSRYGALGLGYSHNFAEYYAILEALKFCISNQDKQFTIKTDSKLCVDQLLGAAVTQAETLVQINQVCLSMFDSFNQDNKPRLIWIPREKNALADTLTKKAIDYLKKSSHVKSLALESWSVEPWNLIPQV